MKKVNWVLLILYAVLLSWMIGIGLIASSHSEKKEKLSAQQIVDTEQSKRIEELEKEIRLLKSDIDILMYGYEVEK